MKISQKSTLWVSLMICLALLIVTGCVANVAAPTQADTSAENIQVAPVTADHPAEVVSTVETMANQKITVSGIVISGGDTTPQGLMDAPRTYVYTIQLADGKKVDVSYVAYPPGPRPAPQYTLKFYSGQINVGDQLTATGVFDTTTNRLVISQEGDSIQTSPKS